MKLSSQWTIRPVRDADGPAIEAVLDAAFGTDRHQRTAYRVREGMAALADLTFVAVDEDGRIIGSLQCWPVQLGDGPDAVPLVMLGPVAVLPGLQRAGIGKALMERALQAADSARVDAIMLIGDAEYYGRFFGFDAAPTGQWDLPGPFERPRLLVRLRDGVVLPKSGMVGPRKTVPVHGLA